MCVCMCTMCERICVYACMRVYVNMCTDMHANTSARLHTSMCMCMNEFICVCLRAFACVLIHTHIHTHTLGIFYFPSLQASYLHVNSFVVPMCVLYSSVQSILYLNQFKMF